MKKIERRTLSIFDILGPTMIGPSSSHTAGALRIGRMGRALLGKTPSDIRLFFTGVLAKTYSGHMTDSALIAGLMGMEVDDPLIGQALFLARKRGISVSVHEKTTSNSSPNEMEMEIRNGDQVLHVAGLSVGGGEIEMIRIDEFNVNLKGNEDLLLLWTSPDINKTFLNELLFPRGTSAERIATGEKEDLYRCRLIDSSEKPLSQLLSAIDFVHKIRFIPSIVENAGSESAPAFTTFEEMKEELKRTGRSIPEIVLTYESKRSGSTEEELRSKIGSIWDTMKSSIETGLKGHNALVGGLMDGNDSSRMLRSYNNGHTLSGDVLPLAIARALACMETNGSMGRIVAAPTAGACGVLPGTLLTIAKRKDATMDSIIDSLLVAAITGILVASVIPISGAMGGCQSEIGVASAMTAAALTHMGGGNPDQISQSVALALKSLLGLICDPVAGPVEVPCIKRNAIGVANAFSAADMALADIKSVIPTDEVILAMKNVQDLMPCQLKGSIDGGLGSTETAKELRRRWLKKLSENH